MAFEQRPNSGSLFHNDRKEKDTHPSHTGTALIDGKAYYISAWVREGRNGSRFFSLAFKPKDKKDASPKPKGDFDDAKPDFDDPIPF